MKRTYLLIFATLLCTINIIFAENWLPFNPGQISYFQIENYYYVNIENDDWLPGNSRIIPFIYDSMVIRNDVKTFFSKEYIEYNSNYHCLSTIYDGYYQNLESNSWVCNRIQFDSIQVIKDTLVFSEKYLILGIPQFKMGMLKIPLSLQKGDSFIQENYLVQNYNIEYKSILDNVSDSVKTYRIFNKKTKDDDYFEDYYMELSKNFGIIKFSQWDNIVFVNNLRERQEMNLSGLEINGLKYGAIPKEYTFETFFNLQVGDIKYWKYLGYNDPWKFYNIIGFMKDSLIKIENEDNKYIFTFGRTELIEGNKKEYEVCEIYDKSEINDMIKNSGRVISFLKYVDVNSYQSYKIYPQFFELSGNYVSNPLWSKNINSWGYYLQNFIGWDFDSCNYINQFNVGNELMIFPGIGSTYSVSKGDFGGSAQILLGYKSGDNILGMIPEPLSVNQNENSDLINISPNPTSDKLTLSQIPDGAVSYEILDIFGNRVLSLEPIHELSLQIDVSKLLPGVYFLKLNNQKPVKFIKL